ncbi:hypothetical protein N7495_003464 [Penicillium taxi]|uniref:uncharacterized protein n=1 Tax=Penicillium taxi TaxID=168475 RepID=UPI002544F5E4|nr:uncharacterized protein N7495_003464 [Penicillium taxi]KAJ5902936.1 hypothetical protein N7495_003464 [Penicillium taxi]
MAAAGPAPAPTEATGRDFIYSADYMACVACVGRAKSAWREGRLLTVSCVWSRVASKKCDSCIQSHGVCHSVPFSILYESWVFHELLDWAKNADSAVALPSTGLSAGTAAARLATGALSVAFRSLVESHCSDHALDLQKAFDTKNLRNYFASQEDKARRQLSTKVLPIVFPDTLCRIGHGEAGFLSWNTTIKAFFYDISQEFVLPDGAPVPPVNVEMAILNMATKYTNSI